MLAELKVIWEGEEKKAKATTVLTWISTKEDTAKVSLKAAAQ